MEPSANGHGSETSGPIVPRAILRRNDLRSTDKLVLAFVSDMAAYFSRSGGDFRMSHQRMAEELGMEDREVRRSVRKLSALGLLLEEKRPGKTTILRPTPPSKSGVPRRLSPDTPPFKSDHPAVEVRGTPPFKSDERTTVMNYSRERQERTGRPPQPSSHDVYVNGQSWNSAEEESRIRASFSRVFEKEVGEPALLRPKDLEVVASAARLGTCIPFPDLDAEFLRTLRGVLKRPRMRPTLDTLVNHVGETWEDSTAKQNGRRPIPQRRDGDPFGYDPVTGRPYHPGA